MMAELGRAHDTTEDINASWRCKYLDSDDALQTLVTEAARLYPLSFSTQQQGTLPPGASHTVNGVEIPPEFVAVMCIYAENLKMGESFDPDR